MRLRDYFTNVLLIGQAIAFLWVFSLMARYGVVRIHEPNLTILILEIALFTGIIAFGIANIVRGVRR